MSNRNTRGKSDKRPEKVYVQLPYDFVPFAEKEKRQFPYSLQDGDGPSLPKHNVKEKDRISGVIDYRITPYTPIVAEVRKKWGSDGRDSFFISGSVIRGKVRSNLELLGAGYPKFVDRSPLLYRNVSDPQYRTRIASHDASVNESGDKREKGIEYVVQVGFLRKEGNHYYVVPAKKFGDKYFMSIKEHKLRQFHIGSSSPNFAWLFHWGQDKSERNKKVRYDSLRRNPNFYPYQREVTFRRTESHSVSDISFDLKKNLGEKGFLYNSTHAHSKRSHYLISLPIETDGGIDDPMVYLVPSSVIIGYERNLKKFRVTESKDERYKDRTKQFYNIFDEKNYDLLLAQDGNKDGLIVFFTTCFDEESGKTVIKDIGRTPYFKVRHRVQIADIIGEKPEGKLDYAEALFGFAAGELDGNEDSGFSYKSRLRFSPVDIQGKPDFEKELHNLVLLTPQATASTMYLQQSDGPEFITYESNSSEVKLNGQKYYHILKKPIPIKQQKKTSLVSSRFAINPQGIALTGKIYFHNLSRDELGLLLLSLDCSLFLKSEHYKESILQHSRERTEEEFFELIGGAKPYGYGKVKIKVENLAVEKEGIDFESLLVNPTETVNHNWSEYIDAFIEKMGGSEFFNRVNLRAYLESKREIGEDPKRITWESLADQIKQQTNREGGYPPNWVLKKRS